MHGLTSLCKLHPWPLVYKVVLLRSLIASLILLYGEIIQIQNPINRSEQMHILVRSRLVCLRGERRGKLGIRADPMPITTGSLKKLCCGELAVALLSSHPSRTNCAWRKANTLLTRVPLLTVIMFEENLSATFHENSSVNFGLLCVFLSGAR